MHANKAYRRCAWLLGCGVCVALVANVVATQWTPRAQARRTKRCWLPLQPSTWGQRVRATAETRNLRRAWKRAGYQPPRRSYFLGAQIVSGVGQPAFRYISDGNGGFASSPGRYWPASTIKLWAAVGASMRLYKRGLDGGAWLQFPDAVGTFSGQPTALYHAMSNIAYDRMLRIASLQQLNHTFRKRLGYKHLVLRRGYGGSGSMKRSPKIPFLQAAYRGTLPAQRFVPGNLRCRKNCTSLFEIQDVLRRVVLHESLPPTQRLAISKRDARRLRASLRKQWKWIKDAVHRQLGKRTVIYSKAGSVPGNHLLDNALLASPHGRYLLTVASPWPRRQSSVAPALRKLNELARQGLWQLQQMPTHTHPTAQSDAGPPLRVTLIRTKRDKRWRYRLTIKHAKGILTSLRVWQGTTPIAMAQRNDGKRWRSRLLKQPKQGMVFTIQGSHKGKPTAYRSLTPKAHIQCR